MGPPTTSAGGQVIQGESPLAGGRASALLGTERGCRASGLGQKVPLGAGREAAIRGTFCKDHKSLPESRLRGSVGACHSQTQMRFWKTLSRWSPRPPVAAPDLSPGPLRALVSPAVAPGAPPGRSVPFAPVLGNVCCVHLVLICGTSGKILALPSPVATGRPQPGASSSSSASSAPAGGPATPLCPGPRALCSSAPPPPPAARSSGGPGPAAAAAVLPAQEHDVSSSAGRILLRAISDLAASRVPICFLPSPEPNTFPECSLL